MGCFSTCFPKSKTHKSLRPRKAAPCLNQLLLRDEDLEPLKLITHVREPENIEVTDKEDEPREKLTISGRKKVTFDLNLKFYEGVSEEEDVEGDFIVNSGDAGEDDEEEDLEEQKPRKENESQRHSDSSSSSSLFSFPHNSYRYQNCRDSDDEFDQLVSDDESDLDQYTDDEDEDDEEEVNNDHLITKEEESSESLFSLSIDSRKHKLSSETGDKEVNSPMPVKHSDSVLQPVENLAQWKAMKLRAKQGSRNRAKENKILIPESKSDKEVAVDASLSNWLVGCESASPGKSKTSSDSVGNSPSSSRTTIVEDFEDRPILGALTVEEIKQSKATLTPKRSPSRSPDDTPIIGSVGSYWNHTDQSSNSGNSRSKFIEGRRGYSGSAVAFEKRLERALEA